jgi:hypothetical protein
VGTTISLIVSLDTLNLGVTNLSNEGYHGITCGFHMCRAPREIVSCDERVVVPVWLDY